MVEQFVVGFVRRSHGLTGEFRVESASGEYSHFADMEEVSLTDGKETKLFKVESTEEASATLYMKLAGINSPEEAAKYNGWEIVVPREKAHPLQKDKCYYKRSFPLSSCNNSVMYLYRSYIRQYLNVFPSIQQQSKDIFFRTIH